MSFSLLGDRQWSATGDRYLLSLFRDLVFHSSSASSSSSAAVVPVVDLGFVVEQLSRLDVASSEKALLQSRDGESLLIVRYHDLHRALQQAMMDIVQAQHHTQQQQQQQQSLYDDSTQLQHHTHDQ